LKYVQSDSIHQNSTHVERFIDNYFLSSQRVSFKNYLQRYDLSASKGLSDVVMNEMEQQNLLIGHHSSMSYIEYDELDKTLFKNDISLAQEEISTLGVMQKIAENFTMQKAQASTEGIGMVLGLAGIAAAGGAVIIKTKSEAIKKFIVSPYSRATLFGVMLASNIFMISHINKEIEKAGDRKDFINDLMNQTLGAGAAFGCTTSDRNSNLSKPACFCYTSSGDLNPSRSNSATCKSLFGNKPKPGTAKNPKLASNTSKPKSCVSNKGNIDEKCECAKTKSCAAMPQLESGSVPAGLFGNLPTTINGLSNGTISGADVDPNQFSGLNARAKAFTDQLVKKNPNLAMQLKKSQEDAKKIMNQLSRDIAASPNFRASPQNVSASPLSATDPGALEKLKDELKKEATQYETSTASSGGSGKKDDELNFGVGSEGEAITIEDEKLAEVMGSEFDLTAGEINDDSGANIFDILTNRYQRSGLRRLFGGEATVPADKPNEVEINQ
jgi:hypothetical protein